MAPGTRVITALQCTVFFKFKGVWDLYKIKKCWKFEQDILNILWDIVAQ